MPTYEYQCEKCGAQFEVFQSITAEPLRVCPRDKCLRQPWGKGRVKRMMSGGAGLIFKGSGFYITDYRSESYKAAAKRDTESSSSGGGASKSDRQTGDSKGGSTKPAAPASGGGSSASGGAPAK